ncbi:ribonuclease H-like domain-containing protein [Tanacetum coccineum]
MTNCSKDMFDLVDILELKLTVGHPNGTLAKITHVGNLKLNNDVVLFDVLVVPKYYVSMLSVHKLIKDSKLSVGFDEINQPRHDDQHIATPKGKENLSEGNVSSNLEVPTFENVSQSQTEEAGQWNHKLSEAGEAGFVQSKNNHSLFVKNTSNASLFLLVYVDDLVITGTIEEVIDKHVMTPLPENIVLAHKKSDDDNQHMHSHLKSHFDIALRVLKYLKLDPGNGIEFSKRSMAYATCEVMWIVKVMKDLNVVNLIPANLYCDNKSAIQIVANPVMHEKTKHFDIDVYLVREKVSPGLIKHVKVD